MEMDAIDVKRERFFFSFVVSLGSNVRIDSREGAHAL
jgi:hypothetical protein